MSGSLVNESVAESPRLRAALASYLTAQLAPARVTVSEVVPAALGHTAENWIVTLNVMPQSGDTECRRLLLRRQSRDKAWDSSREREFRVLTNLRSSLDVPIPHTRWSESSGTVLDRPFMIADFIDGEADYDLFRSSRLPPADLKLVFDEYADLLARIHSVPWQHLGLAAALECDSAEALADPGGRQLAGLVARLAEVGERFRSSEIIDTAFRWLGDHRPTPERLALVHADFGPHNVLMSGRRVMAVIDWEFATISDPAQDLAWFTLRGRSIRDNFDQDFYSAEEFLDRYAEHAAYRPTHDALRWWQVFGMCRTVVGRARQGVTRASANRASDDVPDVLTPLDEDEQILARLLPT